MYAESADFFVTLRCKKHTVRNEFHKTIVLWGVLKILIFESPYKIKVSFRLLFVFCGVFLSSFSVT